MFHLPQATVKGVIIPKNAFDTYTNSKQKQALADKVLRIKWGHKLAVDTVNLRGKEIDEIQVFEVQLKYQTDVQDLLAVIDKAMPYHIIFIVSYQGLINLVTSPKHLHPTKEDSAVIDYTFNSGWLTKDEVKHYELILRNDLDWVYKNFCEQFNTINSQAKDLSELVANHKNFDLLNKQIEKLKAEIKKAKQFNIKVELNLKLKELEEQMIQIIGSNTKIDND